jgi:putative ABC transport system ATP-binding protein
VIDAPSRALDSEVPVISLSGVGRTYPGDPPVPALHPVDLVVHRGDYLVVVGPSGSGKSTFLNVLGLLDRPSEGCYRLDGIDVSDLSQTDRAALRGHRIGFVFQAFHLLAHRSAVENVELAQLYNGVPRKRRRPEASAALRTVGLGHRLTALPTTMSGGERQRVAVARALVNRPSLLLCDEPTGNLDSHTARIVLGLLDGLHSAGLTIIVITHDATVAARGSRLIQIHDGIVTEAPPA